jgi:hypothetical protein
MLAAAGVLLVSWVAVSQPGSSVVEPLVLWNTYLGGPGEFDEIQAIQQNAEGDIFVVGTVGAAPASPSPNSPNRFGALGGDSDVLIARFHADGGLVWYTRLGGTDVDLGEGLVLGDQGELYVTGTTQSQSIQWTLPDGGPGNSTAFSLSSADGFVARLDSSGTQLDWLFRIGGADRDMVHTMIPGPDGHLFIGGMTRSSNILGPNPVLIEGEEGFVTRIDPRTARVDWTVLLSAPGNQGVMGLAYKADGTLFATGYTQASGTSTSDALIARIPGANTSPGTPVIRSYGGSGHETGIALSLPPVTAEGQVVLWGTTFSRTFPGVGEIKGDSDIFAVAYDESAGGLSPGRAALFGGSGQDQILSLATDSSQRIYLGGYTTSSDLPVDGGFDTTLVDNTLGDGFVARVRLTPEPAVEWGSFVGGSGEDDVFALWVDPRSPERLYLGGGTTSKDIAYSDAGYDTSPNGALWNMYLLGVDLEATPPGPPVTPPGPPVTPPGSPVSPLGWSCGASGASGGLGPLALGSLVGLALLASRRRPRA